MIRVTIQLPKRGGKPGVEDWVLRIYNSGETADSAVLYDAFLESPNHHSWKLGKVPHDPAEGWAPLVSAAMSLATATVKNLKLSA